MSRYSSTSAAFDQQVATGALPQPADFGDGVAPQHGGVGPRRLVIGQGGGDHILVDAVHPLAEVVPVHRGPGGGKSLVSDPPEQERLGVEELVVLELVSLCGPVELEGPPGLFHHPVDRHEFGHDNPAHDVFLSSCDHRRIAGATGSLREGDLASERTDGARLWNSSDHDKESTRLGDSGPRRSDRPPGAEPPPRPGPGRSGTSPFVPVESVAEPGVGGGAGSRWRRPGLECSRGTREPRPVIRLTR
jgi:hypothetical protein